MAKNKFTRSALGVGGAVAAALYVAGSHEEGALWAALLLSLSLLFEFVILYEDNAQTPKLVLLLIAGEGAKILAGGMYWYLASRETIDSFWSGAGFCAALTSLALAIAVIWLTFHFTVKEISADVGGEKKSFAIPQTIEAKLCCILLAFLHVTYFMTFALAIEDKATSGRSLHPTAGFVTPRDDTKQAIHPDGQSTCQSPRRDLIRRFYFATGSGDLSFMKKLAAKAKNAETLENDICNASEQLGREAILWPLYGKEAGQASTGERRAIKEAAWNLRQQYELSALLKQLKSEHHKYRAQLQGHATDDPPSEKGKNNNFERSLTRAQYIKQILMDLMVDVGAPLPDWEVSAVGSDASFLEADQTHLHEVELNPQLCVEVWLRTLPSTELGGVENAPRPLTLLDYTYFMIYTITTTGYGDLVPSSPFARFLTSMANLFELFFLVIIVNLVMVLRSSTPPKKTDGGEPAATPS